MKLRFSLCLLALFFSSATAAQDSIRAPAAEADFTLHHQILAELRLAPTELLSDFVADERKLKDFISGRLQDMALADYARQRGLDKEPNLFAHRMVEERKELVRAAVLDFQNAERAKLPDLEPLAQQRYLATREQFAVPEQIRLAHILLRADVETQTDEEIGQQRVKAEQLKARLAAGEDFGALAKAFSEEKATAEKGGELPRLAKRGSFVPPFERAAWALGEGEVSDVVRTRFGFHIIKVLELKPASYKPFEEVRNEVIQAVQDEILAPKRSAFVDSFRGQAIEAKAALILPEIQDELKALQSRGTAENSAPAASVPGK